MKHTEKSFLCLLALLAAAGTAVSCGSEVAASVPTDTVTAETTFPAESEDIAVAAVPADARYDGEIFTFLVTGNTENNWQKNDFAADAETGEVLNDARFARNLAVEERFGVKIKTEEQYGLTKGEGTGFQTISKCVMAGEAAYDAGMIAGYDCATLAYGGYLYNLCDMPYIDMTACWWNQRVNEDLTIRGKLYYTTGDISTADNDATGAILFNKKLMSEYDLGDPYALVREGKWTIDALTKMSSDIPPI